MLYAQEQAWHAGAMRAGYPGAIDHVMDRGARRQDIFVNDDVQLCAFEPGARAFDPLPGPQTAICS
jgi:hypothetical protein